uniref:Uncharacterized protein n=1 Tax=Cacopsylla melanoneura TaxID=428564 RepID=A0A8D8T128_9HEMI
MFTSNVLSKCVATTVLSLVVLETSMVHLSWVEVSVVESMDPLLHLPMSTLLDPSTVYLTLQAQAVTQRSTQDILQVLLVHTPNRRQRLFLLPRHLFLTLQTPLPPPLRNPLLAVYQNMKYTCTPLPCQDMVLPIRQSRGKELSLRREAILSLWEEDQGPWKCSQMI